MKGEESSVEEKDKTQLSTVAALLDMYGDRAVSFASLFVASIFGLVTLCAITQALGSELLKDPGLLWRLAGISFALYVSVVLVSYHLWSKYCDYADLAEKLSISAIRPAANLKNVIVVVEPRRHRSLLVDCLKKDGFKVRKLENREWSIEGPSDDLEIEKCKWPLETGKSGKEWPIDFRVYLEYINRLNDSRLVKRVARVLPASFALFAFLLAILTYMPIASQLLN